MLAVGTRKYRERERERAVVLTPKQSKAKRGSLNRVVAVFVLGMSNCAMGVSNESNGLSSINVAAALMQLLFLYSFHEPGAS